MEVSTFANADETLQHMKDQRAKHGDKWLTEWVTADGKFIDETVLQELVAQGKVTYAPPQHGNMYSDPHYYLVVVEPEPIVPTVEPEPTKPTVKATRFKKQSIEIPLHTPSGIQPVLLEAIVIGDFAIHGRIGHGLTSNSKDGWTLTYIGDATSDYDGSPLKGLAIFTYCKKRQWLVDTAKESHERFGNDTPLKHQDFWLGKKREYRATYPGEHI